VEAAEEQAVRSIRTAASAWPFAGVRADPPAMAPARGRRADRMQTRVLVASALVLGIVIGGAVFVGAWRVSADQRDRADAARARVDRRLHDAQARSVTLGRKLHGVRIRLSTTLVKLRRAEREAAGAGAVAARDQESLAALRHDASKVVSDVAALEAYVSATPSQALDAGFLHSQLAYLAAAARKLQAR
jgi:hypothetical protein